MKLINIAISILVIGYFMLVSCSSDEGGESGNGPQATGQELERQLLDTHWKLTRETKVENGTEKVLNNPCVLNTITFEIASRNSVERKSFVKSISFNSPIAFSRSSRS